MSREQFEALAVRLLSSAESGEPGLLLESQLEGHPWDRQSLLALGAQVRIEARDGMVKITEGGRTDSLEADPWEVLQQVRGRRPGWYLGYFGYDLKNHVEALESKNPDPVGAPDMLFFLPERLYIHDRLTGRLLEPPPAGESGRAGGVAGPGGAAESPDLAADSALSGDSAEASGGHGAAADSALSGDLAAQGVPAELYQEPLPPPEPFRLESLEPLTPGRDYVRCIEEAKALIREGEVYEVNLSHLLQGRYRGRDLDLYRFMKARGPVPFAAFLRFGKLSVCCSSPERFLRREGERLFSEPIKGTGPRLEDPDEDRRMRKSLQESEKERAENLMIVDLVRHDLSRVTLPGTIRVPELCRVESFGTVHQLVSTVEGRVRPGTDPVDMVRACFPMGSMTGAPKIRSMEVIERLEEYRRGIYSGAIGYLRPDGDFDFNVVIRTAILDGERLHYPVGGAVTSDSDAEKELEETWVKARALTRALHSEENRFILPD